MSGTYLPGDTRQRIQDLIKNRKVTQAELADKIGISESALSRYLQGKTEMLGDGYIIRIAKLFEVSTDFLLGETDIPDRKNYDIEELGLSADAARNLYTQKVNPKIVSQLLENPRFPQLSSLLASYQNETMAAGIAAMNQNITFVRSLLMGQANLHPEQAEAAKTAATDLQAMQTPAIFADTNAIQNLFMQIVRDLKDPTMSNLKDSKAATAEVLEQLRKELSKGQDAVDLSSLTASDMSAAIMKMLSGADVPEETMSALSESLTTLFSGLKVNGHDE